MAGFEAVPLYRPGADITGKVAPGNPNVKGGTFVDTTGLVGALPQLKSPAAGGATIGVAATDPDPVTGRVTVIRGAKSVVPVIAGGAVAAGAKVQVDAAGKVVTATTGAAVGRAWSDGGADDAIFIELY